MFTLLFALAAHADVSNFDITKSNDGKTIVCQSAADLGKTGYRPLITTMRVDGHDLVLNTAVANLVCVKKNGKYDFDSRKLVDPIPGHDLDGKPYVETLAQVRFVVLGEIQDILAEIDGQNDFMQALEYRIPVTKAFTAREFAMMAAGETLHVRFSFFMQGTHSISQGTTVTQLGLFTGGSYDLTFDIAQVNAQLTISNFLLK